MMSAVKELVSTSLWFVFIAALVGSPHFAYYALFPISLLAVGFIIESPHGIGVRMDTNRRIYRVGEEIKIRVNLSVERGVGWVVIRNPLPPEASLVEGSNVRTFFKGLRRLEVEYEYVIVLPKRGRYTLPPTEIYAEHVLGVRESTYAVFTGGTDVTVMPEFVLSRRLHAPRKRSKLAVPVTTQSVRGALSTDFKEIREYLPSDPLRFINWKATARLGEVRVNEYEREGKKTVFFFVDVTGRMGVGSTLRTPLEYSASLVASLSYYFLKHGYNVGLYLVGSGKLLMPSTGSEQFHSILRALTEVQHIEGSTEGFRSAVEKTKRIVAQYTPLLIYVTNLIEEGFSDVAGSLTAVISAYRKRLPAIVIDVSPYSVFEDGAVSLIELEKRALSAKLSPLARVIHWDPSEGSVSSVLAKTIMMVR